MKIDKIILSFIGNYKSWLGKTLYRNEEPEIVQLQERNYKLIYKNFDINILCYQLGSVNQYGFRFEWSKKNGKLHREDGPAVECWSGVMNQFFEPYNHYYYLNDKLIHKDTKSHVEIEENKDWVILEKERFSSLFWKIKYLTSNELKEEYVFDLSYRTLANKRLYNLKIDSK